MDIMQIQGLSGEIESELKNSRTEADLTEFFAKYLGKSGVITKATAELGQIEANRRAEVGQILNTVRQSATQGYYAKVKEIHDAQVKEQLLKDELVDITIPAISGELMRGSLHPITKVRREVEDAFSNMGFIVEDGPEVATEFENFEAVNVPKNHPARDMQDTFWLNNGDVLRTQTSAWQNHCLKTYGPEFRAIVPGRCFRNEATDASHDNTFFQCEGMMVGEDISISNLVYFMKTALTSVLGKEIDVRLRPGYFPFTEPSFELDMSCVFCGGEGCQTCKHSGWIEFCGCGMIHPKVLEMGGVDPTKYQGFAFGFGLTRLTMMKYDISDIRLLNSGSIDFIKGVK
ncbi:MAG: phenylalanine--tRNA ligase subunit alpha [Christensenellaceae bacterium]|jgi:phenylalanyl-tRNA synthetase alpha chain|nr:phenylalanine--tRNA ligase subunit alpha [Christensenellaceae bacterium]